MPPLPMETTVSDGDHLPSVIPHARWPFDPLFRRRFDFASYASWHEKIRISVSTLIQTFFKSQWIKKIFIQIHSIVRRQYSRTGTGKKQRKFQGTNKLLYLSQTIIVHEYVHTWIIFARWYIGLVPLTLLMESLLLSA